MFSAVCCGIDAIIFTEKNAAPLHEDMVKTSAGAMMQVTFCREKNIASVISTLKLNGIRIISSDLQAEKSLLDVDFKTPTCLVLGAEEKGISKITQEECDETFIIPMSGDFDSFNVSVAAGIICFEAMKQRGLLKKS